MVQALLSQAPSPAALQVVPTHARRRQLEASRPSPQSDRCEEAREAVGALNRMILIEWFTLLEVPIVVTVDAVCKIIGAIL